MISMALGGSGGSPKKSLFEVATFWKVAKLTTISTIYLGVLALLGTIVGINGATTALGASPIIPSDALVEILKIYFGWLPYVVGLEWITRVLEIFKNKSK